MADRVSDRSFFAGSVVLLGLLVLAITILAGVFTLRVWEVGDTRCFYRMAEVILRGGTPYVDYLDPKPPLIFFLLVLPLALGQKFAGGLALVGLANLASSAIVLLLGWRLYGRRAGLLASVLFAVNFALAEGYFVITEPFTVTFVLLSAYFLLCGPGGTFKRYLLAGISAGLAIGFKQYALLLLPVSVFLMWRRKDYGGFLPYMGGVLLPLAVAFGAIFLVYGAPVGEAALHWSFGVAGSYMTEGSVEGVPAYKIDDPVIALAWLVLGLSLFCPLILFAGTSLLHRKPSCAEEFFALAGLAFAATLIIRPFLHYWALALPFIILLAVASLSWDLPVRTFKALRGLSDRAFLALAGGAYAGLLAAFALVSAVLMDGLWRPLEILRFYGLADIVLKATGPFMGHIPEPALAVLDLYSAGQTSAWGLIASGAVLLLAAILLARLGMTLYGRRGGFLAGALFTLCIAWSLGYLTVSDSVAVLLIVVTLAGAARKKYLLAGLCLGGAIALKPLAVLILPAVAYLAYREDFRRLPGLLTGALGLPLAASGILWLLPAGGAGYSGISVSLIPLVAHEGGYTVTDPLVSMLNIVLAAVLLTVLLPVAAAALAGRSRGRFEAGLLLAGGLLLLTLPLRLYVHYWFLALPPLALLCAAGLLAGPGARAEEDLNTTPCNYIEARAENGTGDSLR